MLIVELVQHWGQENDREVEDPSHREEAESAVIV